MDATPSSVAAIAALDQPLRRQLYELLVQRQDWTSRDDAAADVDVARSVAAFHLDKLAEAGVLEVTFQRTSGRTGPGAGRPSKLYRAASDELAASVPQRQYDLAGALLADAVDEAATTSTPVADCLSAVARATGVAIGTEARSAPSDATGAQCLEKVLRRHGYEPELEGDVIALANCPFHRLAERHRSLVCGMNLDLIGGILEGMAPDPPREARLAPTPGYCCVRITPPDQG